LIDKRKERQKVFDEEIKIKKEIRLRLTWKK
jgi:hypothetical protein